MSLAAISDAAVAIANAKKQAVEPERDRKHEHIELSLDRRMQLDSRFFDRYAFVHEALPEFDMNDIDLSQQFLGKTIQAPLLVSCMTGGTGSALSINQHLAEGAERAGIALGVGSQRKAIEDPSTAASFVVRDFAPTAPLLGNLGAVQLNYGFSLQHFQQAVDMIDADALALHLNPLQEALQPEGQCNFADLLPRIAEVVEGLSVPVIVKEIGCGLSASTAQRLVDAGVRILDSAGLGGTSWARIEAARADDAPIGELFADWGVPTPDSIAHLAALDGVTVIGSGGVRNGVDVAKAIAMGADLVGLAQPFLAPAVESGEAVHAKIQRTIRELRIAMFCAGARNLDALRRLELVPRDS